MLHGLIGRLGGHRVDTLGDAIEFARAVTPTQRRKRHLAEGLPNAPGVYIFRAADDRPLYVGTSGDIATRVRSYFTAAEKRARISEMLAAAERVEAVECAHSLEAEVRELRLIAAHEPPYNRRSKYPGAGALAQADRRGRTPGCRWSGQVRADDAAYLGPFSSRRAAELAAAGGLRRAAAAPVHATGSRPRTVTPACALAELGRCPAPCEHRITPEEYDARAAAPFRTATAGDPRRGGRRAAGPDRARSPARQRYEEAAAAAVPAGRAAAGHRADAAAGRADRDRRAGRRPAGGPGRLGDGGGAARPAGRRRGSPRPASIRDRRSTRSGRPPRRSGPGHGPVPCATPRRPSGSWPGWSDRRPGWWRCPAGWASPVGGAARFRDLLAKAENGTRPDQRSTERS